MDEKKNERSEERKSAATRDWLKPATVSLHRLDQVCTNIYNLGLADSKQLKATGGHGLRAEHTTLQRDGSKPPLPEPSTKKVSRAWGSSSSIPDLIKKQIQRQRSRPESAKVTRQMRPPSGRRPRPQSAKELADKKLDNSLSPDKAVPGIRGEHCDPSERPDGTSVYLAGTAKMANISMYDLNQNGSHMKQIKDDDDDCEYLYANDKFPNKELAGIKYDSNLSLDDGAPPPPPRGSPNFLHMLESQVEDSQDQNSVSKMIDGLLDTHNTPQKPKREPISFALPTVGLEDDEVRVSFDKNGIVIKKSQQNCSVGHKYVNNNLMSENCHQSSRSCQSPETLIGEENRSKHSEVTMEAEEKLYTHPKCVKVNVIVEDPGKKPTSDLQLNLSPADDTTTIKDQPAVKFDEDKNVMIEITPRETKRNRPQSAKLATYKGRPELRHVKSRTDSGITSNQGKTARKSDGSAAQQNGEVPKSNLSFVTVNYLDDSDNDEEPRCRSKSKKSTRTGHDVETCMSHYHHSSDDESLQESSDAGEGGSQSKHESGSGKKTISKPESNYYELIRSTPHPGLDSDTDVKGKKTKTIKTIELTSDGSVKETVFVSALDVIETKTQKSYVAPRPISAKRNRPASAKKSEVNESVVSSGIQQKSEPDQKTENGTEVLVTFPARHHRVRSAPVTGKPDPLAERIRDIHRNISESHKTKSCTCKGLAHSHSRSNADMSKLASRDRSARRYYTGYAMTEAKTELPVTEVPDHVVEIWTRKDEFEIETDGVRECKEIHEKLIEAGVPVTLDALKRGLLPPTEYGFAGPTYKSNVYPPETPSYTDRLLSDPATSWLSDEHKRVMQLKKKVREATKALEQQRLEEAREAREAEARAMRKAKRKSGRKSKKKRPKSAK